MNNTGLKLQVISSTINKNYNEEKQVFIPKCIQIWNKYKNKIYLYFLWVLLILEFSFIIYVTMIKPLYDAIKY
jgi:hypothetical protein